MFDNKCIRYAAYALCAAASSELCYNFYLIWKRRIWGKNSEINEVLWTNDLTQVCKEKHKTKLSPCNTRYCFIRNLNRVVSVIENARYTIDLSIYIFTVIELCESLLRAKKRGVKIRIICDESMVHSSGSQIIALNKAGIPVRFQTNVSMLMHHKYCVFDGHGARSKLKIEKYKKNPVPPVPTLITGSTNWTFQGFASNWDNLIITSNETLISEFESEFERMWVTFNSTENFVDTTS